MLHIYGVTFYSARGKSNCWCLTTNSKYKALIKEIEELREKSSPILVGTVSVESSEEVSSTSVDTEILARRIGSGLATAGLGGVGTGIGLVFSGLIKGFSRNPSLKDELFKMAILGFALTEAIALFSLMMAFLILFAL